MGRWPIRHAWGPHDRDGQVEATVGRVHRVERSRQFAFPKDALPKRRRNPSQTLRSKCLLTCLLGIC